MRLAVIGSRSPRARSLRSVLVPTELAALCVVCVVLPIALGRGFFDSLILLAPSLTALLAFSTYLGGNVVTTHRRTDDLLVIEVRTRLETRTLAISDISRIRCLRAQSRTGAHDYLFVSERSGRTTVVDSRRTWPLAKWLVSSVLRHNPTAISPATRSALRLSASRGPSPILFPAILAGLFAGATLVAAVSYLVSYAI